MILVVCVCLWSLVLYYVLLIGFMHVFYVRYFQGNPVTKWRAHPHMAFIVVAPPDFFELDRGDSSGAVPPPS